MPPPCSAVFSSQVPIQTARNHLNGTADPARAQGGNEPYVCWIGTYAPGVFTPFECTIVTECRLVFYSSDTQKMRRRPFWLRSWHLPAALFSFRRPQPPHFENRHAPPSVASLSLFLPRPSASAAVGRPSAQLLRCWLASL
jgi:hypothetical protein